MGNRTQIAIVDAFGDPSLASDLASFDSITGLPPTTLIVRYPDGLPKRTSSGWAVETALDVEWAHAIAPAATIDLVVAVDSSLGGIFDAIAFVANSLPNETVLSMSFGLSESAYPSTGSFTIASTHALFNTITSHGTTSFASSGDAGASSCCNIQYPASDPLVVAVGGTSLTLNPDASYSHETTWTGSGAGSSIVFSKPTWQQGLGDSMRDIVDVSYDADPNTGVLVVQGGREFQVGGTSAGAPQWAALAALASQANSARYGGLSPKLYGLASYHDVNSGSNGFFSANSGWDYPTGMGTPDANATVKSLRTTAVISISSTLNFQGITVTTAGTLLVNFTIPTAFGTISVAAVNSTTGALLFSKTYAITSLSFVNGQTRFVMNVNVGPYALSSDVTVRSGIAPNGSVQVTRELDINGDGSVDLADGAIVGAAYGSFIGSSTYNPVADFNADGFVNIFDFAIFGSFYQAPAFR
jgi:subtilase family serine protease